MSSLLDKASRLDQRVFGRRLATPEQWRKASRRWWWWLVLAGFFLLMTVHRAVDEAAEWGTWGAVATAVPSAAITLYAAYAAGAWKVENDRQPGKDRVLGARRPEGL